MKRRTLLAAVGAPTVGVGTFVGSGAFSQATARNRDATVAVVSDHDAYFAIEEDAGLSGGYSVQHDGQYRIVLTEFATAEGEGVNTDARFAFDEIGRFVNQGTRPIEAWGEFQEVPFEDAWLYDDDPDERLDSSNPIALDVGEGEPFGMAVEVGESPLDNYSFTMTAYAEATDGDS